MRHRSFALLACLAALGCGGAATPGSDAQVMAGDVPAAVDTVAALDGTQPVDATAAEDLPVAQDVPAAPDVPAVAGPYPEGPYGSREGSVLANLAWEGYVNTTGEARSTTLAFGPTTLQALRGDGRGYALIHLAEFL